MRQATLCFLVKKENGKITEILLAMKKRSFGVGKWNGAGGKVKEGEEIMTAAIRETEEEIGVHVRHLDYIGVLRFNFPYKLDWDQNVFVYLVDEWKGEPTESEEMAPKWFSVADIPYEQMWDDDKYWLPMFLEEKQFDGTFVFKEGEIIEKYNIKPIGN